MDDEIYRLELGSHWISSSTRVLRSTFADFKNRGLPRPAVRVVESARLAANEFRLLCRDREVTRQELDPELSLAFGPPTALAELKAAKSPWNLESRLIAPDQCRRAVSLGCRVLSPPQILEKLVSSEMYGVADQSLGYDAFERILRRGDPALVRRIREEFDLWKVRKLFIRFLNETFVLKRVDRLLEGILRAGSTEYAEVMRVLGLNPFQRHLDDDGYLSLQELPGRLESRLLAQLERPQWLQATRTKLRVLVGPGERVLLCHSLLKVRLAEVCPQIVWVSRDELPNGMPIRWLGPLK